jgi:predicted S18 family serine protease
MGQENTQTPGTPQAQNPGQNTTKSEVVSIRFETKPELRHVVTSAGYQYMSAVVKIKAYLTLNGKEIEFDSATVTKDFHPWSSEEEVEVLVKRVAEVKERIVNDINAILKLREKLLATLKEYGEVEEYF